jgi:hypothetical protein
MREKLTVVTGMITTWLGAAGAIWGAEQINDWLVLGIGLLVLLVGAGIVTGTGERR